MKIRNFSPMKQENNYLIDDGYSKVKETFLKNKMKDLSTNKIQTQELI